MVIGLYIGVFCLFFLLPVRFRFYYRKSGSDDSLVLEMSFLHGWLKRKKETSLIRPLSQKEEKTSGRWFFFHKKKVKKGTSEKQSQNNPSSIHSFRVFLWRYTNYGLGVALLSYFLPAKYYHWLLVTDKLEKRGKFEKFIWITRFGTGDSAQTAIIHGMSCGILYSLAGYLQSKYRFIQKPVIELHPDYQQAKWDTLIDCIFRIKLGYIIIASLIARIRNRASRRLLKGGVWIEQSSN